MPWKPGPGILVERPALGAVIAGGLRSVERRLALAAIEAADVAAAERHPHHALPVDVGAARAEAGHRHVVDLGQRRRRRVGARRQAHDRAGHAQRRAPDRAVDRARHHRVERRVDARVLGRDRRLIRLDVGVALAVAVGVEHQRRPALRLRGVAGLVEHLRVQPADDRTAAARPQRVVGVVAELQMVRREAGVDERVLLRLRIEHRDVADGAVHRERLRRRVIRARPCRTPGSRRRAPTPRATAGRRARTSSCGC